MINRSTSFPIFPESLQLNAPSMVKQNSGGFRRDFQKTWHRVSTTSEIERRLAAAQAFKSVVVKVRIGRNFGRTSTE